MARARRKHVQQELALPGSWGGARKGAGRPRITDRRASEHHKTRHPVKASQPVHVVCRVDREVGSLRKRHMYRALRWATFAVAKHEETFRIIHFSIQGTHLHLIIEAANKAALSRGMKAFSISAAKHINREVSKRTGTRRTGTVFVDRYHSRSLKTPREVRNAIAYVLNNWRRHGEHTRGSARSWPVDAFSNGFMFNGWKEREHELFAIEMPQTYESLLTWFPRSWLLRVGWRKHGLIGMSEVPGPVAN